MSINCNLLSRRTEPSTNAQEHCKVRKILKIYDREEMHAIFSFLYSEILEVNTADCVMVIQTTSMEDFRVPLPSS
jgi:hypothetical protein